MGSNTKSQFQMVLHTPYSVSVYPTFYPRFPKSQFQFPRMPKSQFHSCFIKIPILTGVKSQIPISNEWNPKIPMVIALHTTIPSWGSRQTLQDAADCGGPMFAFAFYKKSLLMVRSITNESIRSKHGRPSCQKCYTNCCRIQRRSCTKGMFALLGILLFSLLIICFYSINFFTRNAVSRVGNNPYCCLFLTVQLQCQCHSGQIYIIFRGRIKF